MTVWHRIEKIGMRLVLCNGCFDGIHVGHIEHFKQAKAFGDRLIVSVTDDEHVRLEKGAGRPAFTQDERAEVIRCLRMVDGVIIVGGAMDALTRVNPDVFVKGPDYKDRIKPEHDQYCREHGIEIRFTEGRKYSSASVAHEF